ncbi:GRAS family protein RAD1-like [Triticum urartu]|uniref:GRAS family protein RAD1-like n=1 Tax=Triticum urartu TaxID=4572 RepID=UPI001E22EFE9|nr:GRAS family protein RAD1-like [Triticum urartu]
MQTQEGASICTNQELDYDHPHYLGIEDVALEGVELELGPRAPKATKVDYLSSPYNASWPPAQADFESSRVRKTKQFRDVLETCKQKVEAMEALEHSPPVAGGGYEEQAGEAVVAVGDVGAGGGGSGADGMRLMQLHVACAEAGACRDRAQAAALLRELQVGAPVHGTAFQRVASCFLQGLADRLALAHPPALGPASMAFSVPRSSCLDGARREALAVAYELCPYLRFAHFVANASTLEAFDGESNVHVVDLGMTMGLNRGHQWRPLLDGLATRAGGKPARVRVTGVGARVDTMRAVGREIEAYPGELGMCLEFRAIDRTLESLHVDDLCIDAHEAVAINSVLELHCVVKESRSALNSMLQTIRKLSPKAFVLVEQDAGHNGSFFLGRSMEALHYYAALFDALDAALPRYDARRARVEQFYYGAEIRNVVGCEGAARVERHERADQWRRRMSRAGFQSLPIKMAAKAREWLEEKAGGSGYTVAEEKGCLVLGWKGKPVIAASCWKC